MSYKKRDRTILVIEEKSWTIGLEIMTLVSSKNVISSDKVCMLGGRLFMYIMKCKVFGTDPRGTVCFVVSKAEINKFEHH